MTPILLKDEQIPRRTLSHDIEPFFAVIVWIATIDYEDEAAFLRKPLARVLLDKNKTPDDIINAKGNWFKNPMDFRKRIIDYVDLPYRKDIRFLKCLLRLRRTLYPSYNLDEDEYLGDLDENDDKDAKEGLFWMCMKEIDDYLQETKGCDEMQWIDSHTLAPHNPESLGQEGNRVD